MAMRNSTTNKQQPRRTRGTGGLIKPRKGVTKFYYAVWRGSDGRQLRKSTGQVSKEGAAEFLRQRIDEAKRGISPDVDPDKLYYGDLRQMYLDDYRNEGKRSLRVNSETGEEYVDSLPHLDRFFGYHKAGDKGVKVSRITVDAIARFKNERREAKASPGTINRSLAALRRMFKLAQEAGKLLAAPPVKLFSEPEQPRAGFLEIEDYQKLYDALPEHVRPLFQIGYYTGMRLGEIVNLKWDRVSLANKTIRLEPQDTKNKTSRLIPLIDGLPELLEGIRRKNPKADYVFLGRDGDQIGSFRKAWTAACVRAGVKTKLDGQEITSHFEKDGTYRGFLFHDLRRSAVRNMIRAGIPRRRAMKISGHKNEDVFERYNIASEEDLHDDGTKLSEYLTERQKEAAQTPAANPGLTVVAS
jgi:integrase